MPEATRRDFLTGAAAVLAAATTATAQDPTQQPTPGAPPAFGTAPAVGPEVSLQTFAEAEKLVQAPLTAKDRAQVAGNWRQSMASMYERRTGPKKLVIPDSIVPFSATERYPGRAAAQQEPKRVALKRTAAEVPLPSTDGAIAFAPVMQLADWIERRQLTSERLTNIYLARIAKYDRQLHSVITATPELALKQARAADAEIAASRYRGPLHGIPWGGKDLLDTAGIRTTYGAEFYRDRVPAKDAAVVARLHAAGAVMLGKLSMGALALNDVWFGGQTMNPWLPEEGASGSSAGPGAATAAGLVAFAIGSETEGSIVSPSMRCGLAGMRPTFGLVPRTGAMTLCWSLDKLGPMARSVQDLQLVLEAIKGRDAGDSGSVEAWMPGPASTGRPRVGYFPAWMKEAPATQVDRATLARVQKLGMETLPVTLPDWPYGTLNTILFAEAAAAFETITLDHRVDQLKAQAPDAWPNTFRQARFLSAVDAVQADRFRRMVANEMERIFKEVDVLLVPALRDEMLTISNFTGHPSLTLRQGFVEVAETRSDWAPGGEYSSRKLAKPHRVPHGVTLIGRHFQEDSLIQLGEMLEANAGVAKDVPPGFGLG